MVAIGRTLMADARLVMLETPSLGPAPLVVGGLGDVLRRIRDTIGAAILRVAQNVNLALSAGSRGYALQSSRLICEGEPEGLAVGGTRPAYLGAG